MYYYSISEAVRGKKEKKVGGGAMLAATCFLTLGQMTTTLGSYLDRR
jgi:hypothetical protein